MAWGVKLPEGLSGGKSGKFRDWGRAELWGRKQVWRQGRCKQVLLWAGAHPPHTFKTTAMSVSSSGIDVCFTQPVSLSRIALRGLPSAGHILIVGLKASHEVFSLLTPCLIENQFRPVGGSYGNHRMMEPPCSRSSQVQDGCSSINHIPSRRKEGKERRRGQGPC